MYCSETYSILNCLVSTQLGRTNDMDTMEYTKFLYDTVEVE